MNTAGEAFSYAFRDPQWASKLLVQGLITLIPIIGPISTLGWLLETMENLKQGRQELAPAGFHLGKGFQLFVPLLVYGLVAYIPYIILSTIGSAASAGSVDANGYPTTSGVGVIFSLLAGLWILVLGLLFAFILVPVIVSVSRGGMGAGFRLGEVFGNAFKNFGTSLLAFVLVLVADLIGGLGSIVCCVGIIFTYPYAMAILAGVATWFDGQLGGGQYPGYATAGGYGQGGGYGPQGGGYGDPGYGPGPGGPGAPGGYPGQPQDPYAPPPPPGGGYPGQPTPPPPPPGGGYPGQPGPPPGGDYPGQPGPPPPPPGGGYPGQPGPPPPPPGGGYPGQPGPPPGGGYPGQPGPPPPPAPGGGYPGQPGPPPPPPPGGGYPGQPGPPPPPQPGPQGPPPPPQGPQGPPPPPQGPQGPPPPPSGGGYPPPPPPPPSGY